MEGFCRGCLIKYDPTELLQHTEKNKRLYYYATALRINRVENFPLQLCKHCYLKMKLACNFKKMCRTSDKRFKQFAAMKTADDSLDFCTFMKSNEDSMTLFRLPFTIGNSTPVFQRNKDDDNESASTSIRNFMMDILKANDVPDNEVQKIREVIEDEADLLDDSLDSHWLQDDKSLDDDFDFSFSAFSTPHPINNDRFVSPQNLLGDLINKNLHDRPNDENQSSINEINFETVNGDSQNTSTDISELINTEINKIQRRKKFYIENEDKVDSKDVIIMNDDDVTLSVTCTIERNLAVALRDETAEEYCLDDLLKTPPVQKNDPGFSTPMINDILFGSDLQDKTDFAPADLEVDADIEVDAVEYERNDIELNVINKYPRIHKAVKSIRKDNPPKELYADERKYDLENLSCRICDDRTFSKLKSLKIHFVKTHHKRINVPAEIKRFCDICAKPLPTYRDAVLHIKSHFRKEFKCEHCDQVFSAESKLKMHMGVHVHKGVVRVKSNNPHKKTKLCSICSALVSTNNLKVHMRRHLNINKFFCDHCGKAFCRKHDLIAHMTSHAVERRFECKRCLSKFKRRDHLSRHMKTHDLRPRGMFQCPCCPKKFLYKSVYYKHWAGCAMKTKDTNNDQLANKQKDATKVSIVEAFVVSNFKTQPIIDQKNEMESSQGNKDKSSADNCSPLTKELLRHKCKVCRACFQEQSSLEKHWMESTACKAMRAWMRNEEEKEYAIKKKETKKDRFACPINLACKFTLDPGREGMMSQCNGTASVIICITKGQK